ncbi:MAG TPA: ATP synthase subunit C [Anaerolineae bacterium]|nr:ATP synthase subunit C [Anaerolineae bacterium]HQK15238.1 ATP synthase subunit C [Anaerolineae bacterium]
MMMILVLLAMLLPFAPAAIYWLVKRKETQVDVTRKLIFGLSTVNIVMALLLLGVGLVWLFAPEAVAASGLAQASNGDPYASLAAAAAVSLGSIGAAYAVSATGAAAIGAIAEKPDVFGKALIFVGLAEGVAIYGLIIAFIILNR